MINLIDKTEKKFDLKDKKYKEKNYVEFILEKSKIFKSYFLNFKLINNYNFKYNIFP
jgi:hypothetical protein